MVGPASKVKPSWRKTDGAAAGGVELFQHGDAVAARAEPDGRGQATEARADDDGVARSGARRRQGRAELGICQQLHAAECKLMMTLVTRGRSPAPASMEINEMRHQGRGQRRRHPRPGAVRQSRSEGEHQAEAWQEHPADRSRGQATAGATVPQGQSDRLAGGKDQNQIDQAGAGEERGHRLSPEWGGGAAGGIRPQRWGARDQVLGFCRYARDAAIRPGPAPAMTGISGGAADRAVDA